MSQNTQTIQHPRLQAWFEKGRYRQLCGHSIFTIDEGEAHLPVIILVHGFPTASWDWQGIWSSLRENYRLVSLDMLGFGFSDKPNRRDYTIHKQADLFDALIEQLDLQQYHVFAHDYGDSVAQELLARQLEGKGKGQWLSGCFLNGGLFPETHYATRMQRLLLSPLGALLNRLTGFKQFSKSFSAVFGKQTQPSELELREFWELIYFNDGRHLFSNLITYINDRRQHRERWVNVLKQSPVPLSLINGSVDPVSGQHMVARYKELECRLDHLLELSEIGHYPQVEAPQRVAKAYLSFVSSI